MYFSSDFVKYSSFMPNIIKINNLFFLQICDLIYISKNNLIEKKCYNEFKLMLKLFVNKY